MKEVKIKEGNTSLEAGYYIGVLINEEILPNGETKLIFKIFKP